MTRLPYLLLIGVVFIAACQPVATPVPVLPTLMVLPSSPQPLATVTPIISTGVTEQPVELAPSNIPTTATAAPTQVQVEQASTAFPERAGESLIAAMDQVAMENLLLTTPALYIPDDAHLQRIFARGQQRGRQHDFMLGVGDCNTESRYFLRPITDNHSSAGVADIFLARSDVQDLVSYFEPTFSQQAEAANSGFNALSVLDPLWTRAETCQSGESPLACDLRENDPFAMMVMFGANDVLVLTSEGYEAALRDIIKYALEQDVIPILSTFPFHPDGENGHNHNKSIRMNATIRLLADEYGVPLVNFWRAVQVIPGYGILPDNAHLHVSAFEIRNELALEMLRYLQQTVILPHQTETDHL